MLPSPQTSLSPFARREISGDHSGGETPVPIPNTAVKPTSADGTALATGWKSRSLPGISLFLCATHGDDGRLRTRRLAAPGWLQRPTERYRSTPLCVAVDSPRSATQRHRSTRLSAAVDSRRSATQQQDHRSNGLSGVNSPRPLTRRQHHRSIHPPFALGSRLSAMSRHAQGRGLLPMSFDGRQSLPYP
jgi:hypothetical protein